MYIVKTADLDGSSSRRYKVRENAIKRYEEMLGRNIETSIDEQFHNLAPGKRPTRETIKAVRDVSDYGTVISFKEVE